MNNHTAHHHTTTPSSPEPPEQLDHVTPAYAAAAGPHVAHAPLGHALDPHTEAGDHAGMDHAGMGHADHTAHSAHGGMAHDMSDPAMAASMERDIRNRFFVALALTIPTILYSSLGRNLLGASLPAPLPANWMMLLLSAPVVFWGGWMFIGGAFAALRQRTLDMSVLIATGVLAAWLASLFLTVINSEEVFFEAAAMLVTFVLFGHWMEMKSRKGTSESLRALFDLVPPTATVLRDGQETEIPTAQIAVGDTIVLRPGEKVPTDGEVLRGQTSLDEALVTGESLPVEKGPGDTVIGGSINRSGAITFRATRVGSDTALAQIVELVRRAQNSKAPGQRLADKTAQYLVLLAVGAGLITFFAWFFLGGAGFVLALTFAISAVVIACPDALGLATPTAVAVGTGIGARHNILIKDAATLENLSRITAIVLDKTGTLTEGKPRLTDVVISPQYPEGYISAVGSRGPLTSQGRDTAVRSLPTDNSLLRLVASAERDSEHPLAGAIVDGAQERGLILAETTAFVSVAGHGIRAMVEGHEILAGNRKLLADAGIDPGALDESADALAAMGKTPMYVALDGQPKGLIAVADTIKPTARAAIRRLGELGIVTAMITGDNRRTAEAVARELGIARVFAEVLPADKADHVAALQAEGRRVAMVGDGVNDAPALARADIGIAIGAGTDVAIETASVVLMKSDPLDILSAITLSRATVRKMKQNLGWASVYNILAIPVAAGVLYPAFGIMLRPEWSALLMSLSSIIVAINAVLLRRVEGELQTDR
ncbi:MAG TPA: heavy metal translocating P-type ATPase [Thermomicrobiales bacterium]|jgi:Cu2+-exporting ATPase